jgi:hypothetical protein
MRLLEVPVGGLVNARRTEAFWRPLFDSVGDLDRFSNFVLAGSSYLVQREQGQTWKKTNEGLLFLKKNLNSLIHVG